MTLLAMLILAAQAASPVCSGIRVIAPQLEVQPEDLKFSSRQVLDLQFRARLREDLDGDHLMQFKVLTPNGFLYQTITVPFVSSVPNPAPGGEKKTSIRRAREAAAAAPPAPPRYVPGFPRPLPVQRLVPVPGDSTARIQYELDARLPVAGTSITLSSLYGSWTVQAYLDGQPSTCGPATRFTIEE
jgi:hypothetical protein